MPTIETLQGADVISQGVALQHPLSGLMAQIGRQARLVPKDGQDGEQLCGHVIRRQDDAGAACQHLPMGPCVGGHTSGAHGHGLQQRQR